MTRRPAASQRDERAQFARMRDNIGENPARFLDRPLFDGDAGTSAPGLFIKARIQGIDRLHVLGCYRTVEETLERGPRERVLDLIEDRRAELEAHGERDLPGLSHEEKVKRSQEIAEQTESGTAYHVERDEDGEVVERVPLEEKQATATAKLNRLTSSPEVATDGGESA